MNTTFLHIKIEPDIKDQAQKTTDNLGLLLSAVMKFLLKQLIRTKCLSVEAGGIQRSEIPNACTRQLLKQAEQDMKAGRGISFKSSKEAISYIDALIENGSVAHLDWDERRGHARGTIAYKTPPCRGFHFITSVRPLDAHAQYHEVYLGSGHEGWRDARQLDVALRYDTRRDVDILVAVVWRHRRRRGIVMLSALNMFLGRGGFLTSVLGIMGGALALTWRAEP